MSAITDHIKRLKGGDGDDAADIVNQVMSTIRVGGAETVAFGIVDQLINNYVDALPSEYRSEGARLRLRDGCIAALRQDPKLVRAAMSDPKSLIVSILAALRLGLSLDPALGHAHLIPRRARSDGSPVLRLTVGMIIGWRGLTKLARAAGVLELYAEVVYERDFIEIIRGTSPSIVHRPNYFAERGEALGAYAVARLAVGGVEFEVMPLAEIEQVRGQAGNRDSDAWVVWWGEMAKKSVIRRLVKRLDLAVDPQHIDTSDPPEASTPPEPRRPASIADEDLGIGASS